VVAADLSAESASRRGAKHVLLFSGLEFTSHSSHFGYVGGVLAPKNLDATGLRLFLLAGEGTYQYDANSTKIRGRFTTADALVGYSVTLGRLSSALYVGVNAQEHNLSPDDPSNPARGSRVGLKVQQDVWVTPTDQTMIAAVGSYSTVFKSWFATTKFGYDISGGRGIYLGPQGTFMKNEKFEQWRVGGHISSLPAGPVRVGFSAGYLHSRDRGPGTYGGVEVSARF